MNDASPIVTRDDEGAFHLDLPWGNDGQIGVRLTAEDARRLAHAILDADRHPTEAKPLARVEIIDVAAHARELYGEWAMLPPRARPMPKHDYRFRGNDPARNGVSQVSYGTGYTAADIIVSIEQDRALKAKGL